MKKHLLIATCCALSFASHAQNSNLDFNYALKFSGMISHTSQPDFYVSGAGSMYETTTWVSPSLSFIIKNKANNFHELELVDIRLNEYRNSTNFGSNQYSDYFRNSNLTLRYQYVRNFLRHINTRWMPSLAIGASSAVGLNKYTSSDSYYKKQTSLELNLIGFVAPQISYNISKKFFATFSVPITFIDSYSFIGVTSGEHNHTIENNELKIFPSDLHFKISLSLKL